MSVEIKDHASPALQTLLAELGDAGRVAIHQGAAAQLEADVQKHILSAARDRHSSAESLGAFPTGHLSDAAMSVAAESDADSGRVSISSPGFKRVFGDLVIKPREKRALTIARDALSYGRTVAEVKAMGVPVFRPPGKDYLATSVKGGTLRVLWLLRGSVTLKQDRGLLPEDDALAQSSNTGALAVIDGALAKMAAGGAA